MPLFQRRAFGQLASLMIVQADGFCLSCAEVMGRAKGKRRGSRGAYLLCICLERQLQESAQSAVLLRPLKHDAKYLSCPSASRIPLLSAGLQMAEQGKGCRAIDRRSILEVGCHMTCIINNAHHLNHASGACTRNNPGNTGLIVAA